ncbi:MAG: helicase-related protein [Bacilli bacterium]
MYICPLCGAKDERYFGINKGKIYCRRCITFQGNEAPYERKLNFEKVEEKLNYPLSKEQEEISSKILRAFIDGKNILLHAVCGAGKTELTYKVIAHCLSSCLQVGFAIPRRDVVVELLPRLKEAFPSKTVVAVYGGNTSCLKGDIILLTTHQLYRYKNYFDLLIIDETDAFPFSGNELLNDLFFRSLRGTYLMMSATPLPYMVKKIEESNGVYLKLMRRYHNHPLIVPTVELSSFFPFFILLKYMKKFYENRKPFFVFVPTIEEGEILLKKVKIFNKNGDFVSSKTKERNSIIQSFKDGKLSYLITTSILERGVTVKNLQVIVYNADHKLYDEGTLIQISGRVGRKIDAYDGEVIFIASKRTMAMENAIRKIENANEQENL